MQDFKHLGLDDQLGELNKFISSHPELSEEELLDQMEQIFSREAIDTFTAAFTGFGPSPEAVNI